MKLPFTRPKKRAATGQGIAAVGLALAAALLVGVNLPTIRRYVRMSRM